MKPVRAPYYLRDEQYEWLRERAHEQRISASAVVRLAVDRLAHAVDADALDLREALREATKAQLDERMADPEFQARVRDHVESNRAILDGLAKE